LERDGGGSVLRLQEQFSRAWRRTGLALDRVGFTVEDRDRSRGLYFVRYVDPESDLRGKEEKGFFSKLAFWSSDDDKRDQSRDGYLVSLIGGRDGDENTQVVVLNKDGERDGSPTADRILSLLHEQLR
jgi:outer membrane protein assembly factor BamC